MPRTAKSAEQAPDSAPEILEPGSTAEAVPAGPDGPAPEPQQPNGVLILRSFDDQGKPQVGIRALGDVKITEIATILKMGQRLVDSDLNL